MVFPAGSSAYARGFSGRVSLTGCLASEKACRQRWRSDFRVVPTVLLRHVPASTAASFEVDSGQAGAGRV